MKVLIACEFSSIVRDAFLERGHEAFSCDLLPAENDLPGYHYQGDVFDIINQDWDLMIAHPPCTYLANSGVRWLRSKYGWNQERLRNLKKGVDFFCKLKAANIKKIVVENPIPHKYAVKRIGRYNQLVQPWVFGENESKAVCLWLKELPPLIPDITKKPDKLEQRVWRMAPGPNRQKERSRFFKGIARAMAEQWG